MYYNLTSVSNPVEWIQWINVLTGGYFGIAIIAAFMIIFILAMKSMNMGRNDTGQVISVTLFLGTIFSFLFMIIGLVEAQHVMILTAGFIFSLFLLKKSSGTY